MAHDIDARDPDLQILSAFPQALRDDVVRVVSVLPTAFHSCSATFRTTIGDEALIIPYRVITTGKPSVSATSHPYSRLSWVAS
jgi:hypothetical protein